MYECEDRVKVFEFEIETLNGTTQVVNVPAINERAAWILLVSVYMSNMNHITSVSIIR